MKFQIGDKVVIATKSGTKYFGRIGTITRKAHNSTAHHFDWWVQVGDLEFDGGGFVEDELIAWPGAISVGALKA